MPASLTFTSLACTFRWRRKKRECVTRLPVQADQSLSTGHCSPQQFKGQSFPEGKGRGGKGREGASTCRPRRFAPGYSVAPLGGRGAADCFLSELFWPSLKFWLKVLSTEAGFIRHHVSISQTVQCGSIKLSLWTVSQIYPWVLDSLSEVREECIY